MGLGGAPDDADIKPSMVGTVIGGYVGGRGGPSFLFSFTEKREPFCLGPSPLYTPSGRGSRTSLSERPLPWSVGHAETIPSMYGRYGRWYARKLIGTPAFVPVPMI